MQMGNNTSNQGAQAFETLRIHAGYDSDANHLAVSTPIYQTAAFDLGATPQGRFV